MMDPEKIVWSFTAHSADSDAAVIEGNRGLYDGVDESGTYSTARLARLLSIPVVLIVDCTKASSTVGAVVLGCKNYDPETVIRGVILNNVSPGRHETVVRKAIEQSSGIPVLGAVPRQKKGNLPNGIWGSLRFMNTRKSSRQYAAAVLVAEQHLDLDALWDIAVDAPGISPVETLDVIRKKR